jgi:hypothetical protein
MSRTAKHVEECAGPVLHDDDQRGLVVAGGLRQRPGRLDHHEAGHRSGVVGQVLDQRRESVALGGEGGADGAVELPRRHRLGRPGGGGHRQRDDVGKEVREPSRGLRQGVRMAGHRADARELRPGPDGEDERDVEEDLAGDHEGLAVGQPVHRRGHRTLDGVLQRDQRGVRVARSDGGQGRGDTRLGVPGSLRGGNGGAEGCFGEGTLGPEIGEPRRTRSGVHPGHPTRVVRAGRRVSQPGGTASSPTDPAARWPARPVSGGAA